MSYRNHEQTDWEQALGNLLICSDSVTEQHQRLLRSFQGLEHLIALLLSEVPTERSSVLAEVLESSADRLAGDDSAREQLLRLVAVLRSRTDSPHVQDQPHKALKRGFHWLHELHPLKGAE